MTLRVGIVGAARGGFAHLPARRAIDGVAVTAMRTARVATVRTAADRLGIERPFGDGGAPAECRAVTD